MINSSIYSSAKQDWETPPDLFKALDDIFHFDLDVCATAENAKCKDFLSPQINGLEQPWTDRTCWMNPPYGRDIEKWVVKAVFESGWHRATVVCLVPARTDTCWWNDVAMLANEIWFIRGRIKFVGAENSAPFPSAILVYHPNAVEAQTVKTWDWRSANERN